MLGDLQQCMQVVCHPAESMDSAARSSEHIGYDVVENQPVGSGSEQRLAMIAAKHDVVVRARNMQAGRPWHPCLWALRERHPTAWIGLGTFDFSAFVQ